MGNPSAIEGGKGCLKGRHMNGQVVDKAVENVALGFWVARGKRCEGRQVASSGGRFGRRAVLWNRQSHSRSKIVQADGLEQASVKASVFKLGHDARLMGSHRNQAHASMRADESCHIHSVHLGHLHIDKADRRPPRPHMANQFTGVLASDNTTPLGHQAAQYLVEQLQLQLVVIKDNDACGGRDTMGYSRWLAGTRHGSASANNRRGYRDDRQLHAECGACAFFRMYLDATT